MITAQNLASLLNKLGFQEHKNIWQLNFDSNSFSIRVDFAKELIEYPEEKGFTINERQTCNFSDNENFVVLECVVQLLKKGYKPNHIELEPKWKLGRGASGGRADIFIRDYQGKPLLIVECKTAGREYEKAWKETLVDGGQLFSYVEQEKDIEFMCLYSASYDEKSDVLIREHRIVSHKDNDRILKENPSLKGFKDAKNVKERYRVWKDTYQLEYTEKGIFEENIQPYQIGKDKYTLDIDTKKIDTSDIKGKYHQFRTILRKHNVSRRENAFEVLVNLFLCKIVDETENPNDLKFYWKGIAYDNYFDLVDRLQALYKTGMNKFLNQDIVYISNEEIDESFWTIKQKRNATKERIKEIFRELKFYKGLDFEFIKVFNKEYFNKNAKILLEIIQMWQGLRLKSDHQNQFLGDMFEFFLDNGIKQSEGQFFTPVPICKFIVSSLPLESMVASSTEPLKVIDYACGSGHFLTEYALQIAPIVEATKNTDVKNYVANITGIEKEDRLAKVAKVSAFMYGYDDIHILDADALATNPDVKNESYDILIANPPFAVEDFLLTLDEEDREKFELYDTVNDDGNKNIQCFFLERAKQLLKGNGIMGIIVPSSVLSNSDTTHIKTREILLQYFDFIGIVELGSGTFGKTGTNTVVLFLRRKAQRPEPAEHYSNRVQDFFENWAEEKANGGGAFGDIDIVHQYCNHISIATEQYETLLLGTPSTALLSTPMFEEYNSDFLKSAEAKRVKESKQFKTKSEEEQEEFILSMFLKYLQEIEKDKLFYFMLAINNPTNVLLVKSPTDNKEQKQFLGYEWSGAKGSEGIKYNGGDTIHDIITPLFNPKIRNGSNVISSVIQNTFLTEIQQIPQALQQYCSISRLVDMVDFTRTSFNKAISLTSTKKDVLKSSKFDYYKIEKLMNVSRGASPRPIENYLTTDKTGVNWIKIGDVEVGDKYITETKEKITMAGAEKSKHVKSGDFILSNSMSFGRPYILKLDGCIHDGWLLLSEISPIVNPEYLYEILSSDETQQQFKASAVGGVVKNLNTERVKSTSIPLPPLDVQQQIVDECTAIDNQVENAKNEVERLTSKIVESVNALSDKQIVKRKLEDICSMQAGKFVSASDISDSFSEGSYPCYGGNGLRGFTKSFTHDGVFPIVGRQGALCGNVHIAKGKFHATEHAVVVTPKEGVNTRWLYLQLKSMNLNQYATGVAQPGLAVKKVLSVETVVPSIEEQMSLVVQVDNFEQEIEQFNIIIERASVLKQEVLKKYL